MEWFIIFCIVWILWGIVILVHHVKAAKNRKKENEEWLKKEQEKIERQKNRTEKKKQQYELEKNEIITKYGQPDKVISLMQYDVKYEIMTFAKINRLWLLGEDIPFKDVLSCTYNDDYSIKKGNIEYQSKSKTNNGSMIGRAVIGGILAGGTGAIIGGTTAGKNTQTVATTLGNDTIIHNYTVIININSLSNPIIRIPLRQNERMLNEIVGLMNVIISRSKKEV